MSNIDKETVTKEVDFYQILAIPQNASPEEIKRSYNELVLVHHPDKGGDPQKFKQLQLAYKILSDPKTRQAYTQALSSTYQDLTKEYQHPLPYAHTEGDFTVGHTEEEIEQKRDHFMQQFADARDPRDQLIFEQLEQEAKIKSLNSDTMKSYQEVLTQKTELAVPVVPDLMSNKFDPNLFNQLFEQHKQMFQVPGTSLNATGLDPYQPINAHTRTDLASVDTHNIWGTGCSDDTAQIHDMMFQTCSCEKISQLTRDRCDLTQDITQTRVMFPHSNLDKALDDLTQTRQMPIAWIPETDENPLKLN